MTSDHTARRARIGIIIAAFSALSLAINDIAVPLAYAQGFNTPTAVLARFLFLLASLAVLLPLLGVSYRLGGATLRHALGSGLAVAIGTFCLLGAFAHIPVGLAVVILYTFPILTALLECAYARRLPRPVEFACLLAALAGIGIAIGLDEVRLAPIGLLLAGLAALAYAVSIFWNSIRLRQADGTAVSFHMAVAGTAASALYVTATGSLAVAGPSLAAWLPLFVTCACFAAAFLGTYKAVEYAGGAPIAMTLNLEPVFVIFLAALMLGEDLTLPRVLGSLLVIGAVVASAMWRSRKIAAAAPAP